MYLISCLRNTKALRDFLHIQTTHKHVHVQNK